MALLRGVFFDLDGTLADFDASQAAAFDEAYALASRYHPRLEKASFRRHFDATRQPSVAAEQQGVPHYISRFERFRETLRRLGYPDDPLAQRLAEVYATVRLSSVQLFPDAAPALERLAPLYHLSLITNGPTEVQWGEIQALDLESRFRHILVSEEVGHAKPHPAIFQRALELAELATAEAVFVGDTPETDILGARQAGMAAVWVNRSGRSWPQDLPPPDYTITSLHELPAALRSSLR
ncbi:MAG: HAD family hydrolase [Chloroflexi bacterium]|nr:HAD family hydrolase [Chloroflexota bacterium]